MLCGDVGSRVTSCGGPSGAENQAQHLSTLITAYTRWCCQVRNQVHSNLSLKKSQSKKNK